MTIVVDGDRHSEDIYIKETAIITTTSTVVITNATKKGSFKHT